MLNIELARIAPQGITTLTACLTKLARDFFGAIRTVTALLRKLARLPNILTDDTPPVWKATEALPSKKVLSRDIFFLSQRDGERSCSYLKFPKKGLCAIETPLD